MLGRTFLLNTIRKLGLIKIFDKVKFYIAFLKNLKLTRKFKKENPNIKLPPPYYIYETFNMNYFSFYNKAADTANWLINYFDKYKKLENLKILDWGCGPGRVIRHLPKLMPDSCSFYGSDYNEKYIKWCKNNLQDITFKKNKLKPPLDFDNEYFDITYGISIFTHLSEENHYEWFEELIRVLKKGGIIILTLHGNVFRSKLSNTEKERYNNGNIVIKANTKEGHRTFSAYHPTPFIHKLIGKHKILEHRPGEIINNKEQQDIWIIEKI